MVIRNTFCRRIIVGYGIFFLTVILIWRHHEKSIQLEEDEDTLKPIYSSSLISKRMSSSIISHELIKENRLDYWLKNNSKTMGINLTAILAPKRPGKYLVYVCHENCGGKNIFLSSKIRNLFSLSRLGRSSSWHHESLHVIVNVRSKFSY